jgi:hypothetical protein
MRKEGHETNTPVVGAVPDFLSASHTNLANSFSSGSFSTNEMTVVSDQVSKWQRRARGTTQAHRDQKLFPHVMGIKEADLVDASASELRLSGTTHEDLRNSSANSKLIQDGEGHCTSLV